MKMLDNLRFANYDRKDFLFLEQFKSKPTNLDES